MNAVSPYNDGWKNGDVKAPTHEFRASKSAENLHTCVVNSVP